MAGPPLAVERSDGRTPGLAERNDRPARPGRVVQLVADLRVRERVPEYVRRDARRSGRSRALERRRPPHARACSVRLSAAGADPGAVWTTGRAHPASARRTGQYADRTSLPGE